MTWFQVYCGFLTLLYLLVCALGLAFLLGSFGGANGGEDKFLGGIFLVLGIPLTMLFAGAFILPQQPWAWIYGIVLICIGFTSLCTLPFCIALLIYWLKPEAKHYFGRDLPVYASQVE